MEWPEQKYNKKADHYHRENVEFAIKISESDRGFSKYPKEGPNINNK
jgi:hypothetical protein